MGEKRGEEKNTGRDKDDADADYFFSSLAHWGNNKRGSTEG
jgi:hypothetical protein